MGGLIFWSSLIVIILIPAIFPQAIVFASEYPVLYDIPESEEPVLELTEPDVEYIVHSGDSLWKISEKLWGDGNFYTKLADANRGILANPDLIYPGMALEVSQKSYIVRKEAKYGGFQTTEFSMDTPYGWTVGISESGEAYANLVLLGDSDKAACLIQDKMAKTVHTVKDWEQTMKQISSYAKKQYPKRVRNLQYEHYLMENQGDCTGEVYLYSFDWSMPEYSEFIVHASVGLKLTEHVQAEFIGFGLSDDVLPCVRYVTASFEEHYELGDRQKFTVNNYNMCIQPEVQWELDGMFNAFAFIDEYFTAFFDEYEQRQEEQENEKNGKKSIKDLLGL